MVFFTCSACGASLKKNQVEKHFNHKCRQCEYLTCIDCLKDFPGDTYKAHTKCITENERYGGQNYVPKVNKNENKQLQWVENIQNLLESSSSMDPDIKSLLETILHFENIPRKKSKFINFVKNVNKRVHPKTVEKTWEFFEKALKTKKVDDKANGESSSAAKKNVEEETPATNDSSKAKKRKKSDQSEEEEEEPVKSKKKKKKASDQSEEEEEPVKSKKKKKASDQSEEEPMKSKKKKKKASDQSDEENKLPSKETKKSSFIKEFKGTAFHESSKKKKENGIDDVQPNKAGKFDWEGTIIAVLEKKDGSISLKKLKKKLLAEYESQVGATHKTQEDLLSKLNKKLQKNKKFKLSKDNVILVN